MMVRVFLMIVGIGSKSPCFKITKTLLEVCAQAPGSRQPIIAIEIHMIRLRVDIIYKLYKTNIL